MRRAAGLAGVPSAALPRRKQRRLNDNVAMPADRTHRRRSSARRRQAERCALAVAAAFLLAACGSSGGASSQRAPAASTPSYVTEPFTHEQQLVEQGARLIVSDGCAACHLLSSARATTPSFSSFAGHRVRLADGRSVLVDEAFVREGLLHPRPNSLSGYDPAPMLAALKRLELDAHPGQVAALAAFIEQVGPEPE